MAKSDFAVGLLVGGALGAAFALLYAPSTGDELRSTVKEKASDLGDVVKEKAVDFGGVVKEKAADLGEVVKEKAADLGGAVREKVGGMKHGNHDAAVDVAESTVEA